MDENIIKSFVRKINEKNTRLNILYDDCTESPREWSNVTKMLLFHKKYCFPNESQFSTDNYSSWEELKKAITKKWKPAYIAPVFMLDHSGLVFNIESFGGYNGRFDSGQIGFIVIRKREAKPYKNKTELEKIARNELNTYNCYINGEVFGYELRENDEYIDGCSGFYDCSDMIDYVPDEFTDDINHIWE